MPDHTNDKNKSHGAPTAGNRDANDHRKMPADKLDKATVGNDQLDVDVGDDWSPQRAPQPGTYKPNTRPSK